MELEDEKLPQELVLAGFSERVLAFSIDGALFFLGYWLSFDRVFPGEVSASQYANWVALWIALFLGYQAYCSFGGRVSLGKTLLGIRVARRDGEPLSLGRALMRASAYLPSSVFGLGFLWSLFSPERQGWHDMAAGSVVVADRPKGAGFMLLIRAGAVACLAVLAAGWAWNRVWEPRYHRIMTMAYAHVGLAEMAELQKTYHQKNGRYAESVFDLASVSVAPRNFLRDMGGLFDADAGIDITATGTGYAIAARARDPGRTPVSISGS